MNRKSRPAGEWSWIWTKTPFSRFHSAEDVPMSESRRISDLLRGKGQTWMHREDVVLLSLNTTEYDTYLEYRFVFSCWCHVTRITCDLTIMAVSKQVHVYAPLTIV